MPSSETKTRGRLPVFCFVLVAFAGLASAQTLATVKAAPDGIRWVPERSDQRLTLTVSGREARFEREFAAGREPRLSLRDEKAGPLPDGSYRWELRATPELDARTRKRMAEARKARDRGRKVELGDVRELLKGPFVQSGSFSVRGGKIVNPTAEEAKPERKSEGTLRVAGDLEVEGRKAFTMPDPSSSSSIVYVALEGPEVGTYFRGAAETIKGEAVIELPEHFAKVTEAEGLTAQITPMRSWSRLYVADMTPGRLVVRDAEGRDEVAFNFLIQGVRKGYLDHSVERRIDFDQQGKP